MRQVYHNHHIIPRHAGGTDDPSNIVKITVEEHAAAHKTLFEKYGKKQDFIAWQFLSKQITLAEAIKMAQQLPKSEEWKRNMSKLATERDYIKRVHDALSNPIIKEKHARNTSIGLKGKPKSESHKKAFGKRNQNVLRIECPHCGKMGQYTNMKRWHFENCRQSHKAR